MIDYLVQDDDIFSTANIFVVPNTDEVDHECSMINLLGMNALPERKQLKHKTSEP